MTQEEGFTISNQTYILAFPTLVLTILFAWILKRYITNERATNQDANSNQTKKKNKLNSGSLTDSRSKQPTTAERATSSSQHRQKRRNTNNPQPDNPKSYSHPWLFTTLKAHTNTVLDIDFSTNKKYLASCAEDRTLMLWHAKDFQEKNHKIARSNIEFDHASKVRWSPDSKALVICRANTKELEVYKVNKMADGNLGKATPMTTFSQYHKGEIVGMGIASTGKFIMTCSADTKLVIWSLKGEIMTTIDTLQVDVNFADVSPCGRFVASCGFTSDVKVWQVTFDKTGSFKELTRAYELKGHSARVESFAFNSDSSRMASISKDKTWKFWNTSVEFEKGQEPHLLFTINISLDGPAKLAISFDAKVVAITSSSTLRLFSTVSGKEERSIDNESPIQVVTFDPIANYVAVAVDKHIRLFHNVVGHRAIIQELEEQRKKPSLSQSVKQRMQQQISDARAALKVIEES